MRYLALFLLFAVPQDDGFSVEPLTPTEYASLQKADKDFQEATETHDRAIARVKYAHGQSIQWNLSMCGGVRVTVEIRGKYALIQRSNNGSCIMPAGAFTDSTGDRQASSPAGEQKP